MSITIPTMIDPVTHFQTHSPWKSSPQFRLIPCWKRLSLDTGRLMGVLLILGEMTAEHDAQARGLLAHRAPFFSAAAEANAASTAAENVFCSVNNCWRLTSEP